MPVFGSISPSLLPGREVGCSAQELVKAELWAGDPEIWDLMLSRTLNYDPHSGLLETAWDSL